VRSAPGRPGQCPPALGIATELPRHGWHREVLGMRAALNDRTRQRCGPPIQSDWLAPAAVVMYDSLTDADLGYAGAAGSGR
jgi:hypothetical protein